MLRGAVVALALTASAAAQAPQPDETVARILTRSTLAALNHANLTGNYTVLRDLSAPTFAADYSAADLALAFADLRARGIDLAPVAVLDPVFTEPPAIVDGGLFRLRGYFPSRPLELRFELVFQSIDGRWRLSGLTVDPVEVVDPPAPDVPPE